MTQDAFETVTVGLSDRVRIVTLNRPDKRNAISERVLDDLEHAFDTLPEAAQAVVIAGAGDHFCAGLDLSEHRGRSAEQALHHSRHWHAAFDKIASCGVPVVCALQGAVIGGGLELAAAAHVRVADSTAFYQLPEGRRGIFVGGGASVRVGRILCADRLVEMMLTGRRYDAADGLRLGLSHYLVDPGEALTHAVEIAGSIAGNAPLSNYMILNAIPRIAGMSPDEGLFTESLATALTQSSPDAQAGLTAFLAKTDPDFRSGD